MSEMNIALSRRALLAAGIILPLAPNLALAAPRSLTFAVYRNGAHIGEHRMSFSGSGDDITATTDVSMTVKLGPVPVYKYKHHAVETWAGGRFQSLRTSTNGNGKMKRVAARRTGGGVAIGYTGGAITAPASASPLTHWNQKAFAGPLFNPQEGKMLKVTVNKTGAHRWVVRGEAEIEDWYDADGTWAGLKGKLEDGSRMEYRRT